MAIRRAHLEEHQRSPAGSLAVGAPRILVAVRRIQAVGNHLGRVVGILGRTLELDTLCGA